MASGEKSTADIINRVVKLENDLIITKHLKYVLRPLQFKFEPSYCS